MGTQPRSTQMTLLISVHNIRWVLVPLTHCSKDGHKKASSPWGLYSLVPSLFEGTQHKFGHLIFWKDQNLVHSVYYCRCAMIVDRHQSNEYFRLLLPYFGLSGVWQKCYHRGYCCWLIQFSTPSSSSLDQFLSVLPRHKEMVWCNAIHWTVLSQKQRNSTKRINVLNGADFQCWYCCTAFMIMLLNNCW